MIMRFTITFPPPFTVFILSKVLAHLLGTCRSAVKNPPQFLVIVVIVEQVNPPHRCFGGLIMLPHPRRLLMVHLAKAEESDRHWGEDLILRQSQENFVGCDAVLANRLQPLGPGL